MKTVKSIALQTQSGPAVAEVKNGDVLITSPKTGDSFKIKSVCIGYNHSSICISNAGRTMSVKVEGEIRQLEALVSATKKGAELCIFDSREEANSFLGSESFGSQFDIGRTVDDDVVYGAYKYSN